MHIRRALVIAALVVMVVLAAAPAGAVTPVVGTGTVSCHVGGGFTFQPALRVGGSTPTNVIFHTALSLCTGTGNGVNIKGGSSRVVGTAATNDCATVLQSAQASGPQSGVLKWRVLLGTPPLVPSTITFTSGSSSLGPPITADAGGSATAGSFNGDVATAHVQLRETVSSITTKCLSATGLPAIHFVVASSTFTLG
jgi:hypothetical protein